MDRAPGLSVRLRLTLNYAGTASRGGATGAEPPVTVTAPQASDRI